MTAALSQPSLFSEIRKTLRLALPMMVGQLGQMLLGLADTLMIGRLGSSELATAALVNLLFHTSLVLGIGLAAAVSVQVSHAHGANLSAAEILRHGFWLSLGFGLLLMGGLFGSVPLLPWLRQPEEVLWLAPVYLRWVAVSAVFMLPSLVFKSFAEARHHPWPVFWIMMSGVLLNIGLNRLLIFGWGPFPVLGLPGAGIATFLARSATLMALWIYLHRSRTLAADLPPRWCRRLESVECKTLLKIAAPITGQMLLEFGAFAFSALLIGLFGVQPLAAHQIAITCAATTYMLPLGLSMAVTIRVGHAVGRRDPVATRRIARSAQGFGLIMMGVFAILYLSGRTVIAAAFTADPALRALAADLLVITGIFQMFDGLQVISMGGLRGLKDVNVPALAVLSCYWGFALPLGAWLGFARGLEARGLWIGLATGLALSSLALTLRLGRKLRRPRSPEEALYA
jgi:MATE family multidrug resistance protein